MLLKRIKHHEITKIRDYFIFMVQIDLAGRSHHLRSLVAYEVVCIIGSPHQRQRDGVRFICVLAAGIAATMRAKLA